MEYEQNGADRAEYGDNLIDRLSKQLNDKHLKGFSPISLRMFRSFYVAYPQIQQTLSVKSYLAEFQFSEILQTVSVKLLTENIDTVLIPTAIEKELKESTIAKLSFPIEKLINQLSFSHFIELIKADSVLKRSFYEIESIKNNWSVREL